MHELRRLAYLQAMSVDSYVSRSPLPAAAPTRRLAVAARSLQPRPVVMPDVALAAPAPNAPPPAPPQLARQRAPEAALPRFSLAALVAGDWLWLEELSQGALGRDQVWLVQAMARALQLAAAETGGVAANAEKPADIAQFDWPIHTNRQFDLTEEAARAGVAAFVGRRLASFQCRGLVLLGQAAAGRVPVAELGVPTVTTCSSAQLLSRPDLKAGAWRDIRVLAG